VFGFVTRRELEQLLEERDHKQKRQIEDLAFEWARWYDKFRSLYAMLLKREKKSSEDAPSEPIDPAAVVDHPPLPRSRFPHSRRGF
jgi:hypothetical protein